MHARTHACSHTQPHTHTKSHGRCVCLHPVRSTYKHKQLIFVRVMRHSIRDVLGICLRRRVLLERVEHLQLRTVDAHRTHARVLPAIGVAGHNDLLDGFDPAHQEIRPVEDHLDLFRRPW